MSDSPVQQTTDLTSSRDEGEIETLLYDRTLLQTTIPDVLEIIPSKTSDIPHHPSFSSDE
jgi:hypothetical protein